MEKLQVALEKAREKRSGSFIPRDTAFGAKPRKLNSDEVDEAFSDIKKLKFDPATLRANRVVAFEPCPEATPYDVFRTKLLQLMAANNWKRVAVTSPTAGCGKTTTTSNLSASFGRFSETRVVAVDVDMRRPALSKVFAHKGQHSVRSVFEGTVSFGEQARLLTPNVALSMNYRSTPDPSDLFLRQSTTDAINNIERDYQPDLMIFDLPPLMINDDCAAFLPNVDCAILIAEADGSTMKQIDHCEKELSELTNVLGVVLNKCRYPDETYGYASTYY